MRPLGTTNTKRAPSGVESPTPVKTSECRLSDHWWFRRRVTQGGFDSTLDFPDSLLFFLRTITVAVIVKSIGPDATATVAHTTEGDGMFDQHFL